MKLSEAVREAVEQSRSPNQTICMPRHTFEYQQTVLSDHNYQSWEDRQCNLEYVRKGELYRLRGKELSAMKLPAITEFNDETRAELLRRADLLEKAGL